MARLASPVTTPTWGAVLPTTDIEFTARTAIAPKSAATYGKTT